MKPKYEAPRIISLSEMSVTTGPTSCKLGNGAQANCGDGGYAQGSCAYGNNAIPFAGDCKNGTDPGHGSSACAIGHFAGSACSDGYTAGMAYKRSCNLGSTASGQCSAGYDPEHIF